MKVKQRREKQRRQVPCEVCHLKFFEGDGQERLACSGCAAVVHRNCYTPAFEEKGKNKFRCDQCKHQQKGKDVRFACSVCGKDREHGLLKNVGGEEWMHVLCALTSPRARLASYKTLVFLAEGTPPKKAAAKAMRCVNCSHDRSQGMHCLIADCTNFSHLNCVALPKPAQQDQQYNAFLTVGLLDKHEDSLLAQILSPSPFPSALPAFNGLDLYTKPPPQIRYFVCAEHNRDEFFLWCHCGGEGTANSDSIECERCSRWYHRECSTSEQYCSGCVNNNSNVFEKNVPLPELIAKAVEVQQATPLDKTHVKFLDHFCLKLSEELWKLVGKYGYQVERYYLRKALGETDLTDPSQLDTALEIIFYLEKRGRKGKDEITPEEIEEILQSFTKGNKFDWGKSERIEKRFKTKLEDLLKAIRRDGTREVKAKLQDFIRQNARAGRTHAEIAGDLAELIKTLEASQGWKENYSAFPAREPERHLIEFFYEMKFPQEEMTAVLSALRTLYNPKGKGAILESDYLAIAPIFDRVLPDPKRRIFQSLFDSLMRDLSIRKAYKQKQTVRAELQGRLRASRTGKEREGIRQSILSNRLLITSTSPLMQIERDGIELAVLRRKVIRKYQDPTPADLPELKTLLRKLLEVDGRSQGLGGQQRREFQQAQLRLAFYEALYNHAREIHSEPEPQLSSESMLDEGLEQRRAISSEGKGRETPASPISLRERATVAMMEWKLSQNEAIALALAETHKLAVNCVTFEEKQRETVEQFCENIVEYFSRAIERREINPTGGLLQKLNRIAHYSHCQDSYPHITELYLAFDEWKRGLENFEDISIALESAGETEGLLRVVQEKLDEGEVAGLDLSGELRKLRVVRLWGQLSLKLHPGNRTTITAVQTTRSLMDRIHYPSNCLRRRVEALETESKSLNKRISLFLERPKQAELEVYEELKLMAGKMTLADGVELQRDLEVSELDVEVQLQELVQEIKDYRSFPKNLAAEVDSQSLQRLYSLRRRLFQSSFRLDAVGLQLYHRLLLRITQLKCEDHEAGAPIGKKEYFKFITSGVTGAGLFAETTALHRGYREVEKAERELLSLKPKFENLLPGDCRRVREDLREDAGQLAKVTRWVTASDKAKDRFRQLRAARADISHLTAVQGELLRIPLNNRDVLSEIGTLRRQLQELTSKVRLFQEASDATVQYNSPYVVDLITRYHNLGVRNDYLDKFEGLFNRSRMILEFAKNPTPDNYARFRKVCEDSPELNHNNETYRARETAFHLLARHYLQSHENMVEVGYTLMGEGGYLMKYPAKVEKVLEIIAQIYSKFNKWTDEDVSVSEEADEEKEQDEDDEMEEQGDEDGSSDDEDVMLDEDIDEDSFPSEESSSSHRNRKRPRQSEVVELDDD